MKFKKITLLLTTLYLSQAYAQFDFSPFSQTPETLTTEEWTGTEWEELAFSSATFNEACLPLTITNSSSGSNGSRSLYTYNGDNQPIEIITQGFIDPDWFNNSRTQNTYSNGNITQSVVSFWDDANWIILSRTTNSYTGSNQLEEEIYQFRNNFTFVWENSLRTTYTYNSSGLSEELYQSWNATASQWENEDRTTYVYSGSIAIGILYDIWGSGWEPDEKVDITYNGNQQIIELVNSFWDGSIYEVDIRVLLTYNNDGLIAEILEQDFENGIWVNDFRSSYVYPACASLSITDVESFEFSAYPNPSDKSVTISGLSQDYTAINYTIFDVSGRSVQDGKLHIDCSISTESLNNGLYVIQLDNSSASFTKKVMVRH